MGTISINLVHLAGIEPVLLSELDPKSSASASSAIGAAILLNNNCYIVSSNFKITKYEKDYIRLSW